MLLDQTPLHDGAGQVELHGADAEEGVAEHDDAVAVVPGDGARRAEEDVAAGQQHGDAGAADERGGEAAGADPVRWAP